MRTSKTYEEEVKEKYLMDKEQGNLSRELYKLTPGIIRNLCVRISDSTISKSDKSVLKNFYHVLDENELRSSILNYDIEKLKPICNFLKIEDRSIQSPDALELTALIVDFNPRPFKRYYNEFKSDKEELEGNTHHENSSSKSDDLSSKTTIQVELKNKGAFAWFSNATAANKIIFLFIGVVTVLVSTIYYSKHSIEWMVWQEDHYVEVSFDDEKYNVNQLKLYKEERVKNFKKINPSCDYTFFNKDGNVRIWYGKNAKKELEYFTDLALHPETGKSLKPITQYMIDTHICDKQNKLIE